MLMPICREQLWRYDFVKRKQTETTAQFTGLCTAVLLAFVGVKQFVNDTPLQTLVAGSFLQSP